MKEKLVFPKIRVDRIIGKLGKFISNADSRNEWIKGNHITVYVLKGIHYNPENSLVQTLDIVSVSCNIREEGYFTRFLTEVEKISPYPIYVESVMNERLGPFLIKRNYKLITHTNPPCYFLAQ